MWFFPPCCPVQVLSCALCLHHVFLSEQIKMMMMIFVVIALLRGMNSLTEWQQHDEHNTCICRQRDALFCRSLQVTTVSCSRSESTILQSYRSVVILNNTYTFTGLTALPQTSSWNGGRGKVAPEGGGERGAKGKGRGKGRMGDPQLNYAPGLPPAKSGPAVQSEWSEVKW